MVGLDSSVALVFCPYSVGGGIVVALVLYSGVLLGALFWGPQTGATQDLPATGEAPGYGGGTTNKWRRRRRGMMMMEHEYDVTLGASVAPTKSSVGMKGKI